MTVFNLNGDAGAWFDLEGGGRVQLRTMDADTLKAIRKQTVKRKVEYKRLEGKAERIEYEERDEERENTLFWDHVIMAWENFFDGAKAAIPCTQETKLLLLSKSTKFSTFIGECLKTLGEQDGSRVEAATENLSPTRSG